MSRRVEVQPYCPEWPRLFQAEALVLRGLFGKNLASIHHFGSTSVPGASAKPIIDIMAIVRDINCIDDREWIEAIQAMGYVAKGEYGIPGRRFFFKGSEDVRTHHLHVYQENDPNILRHIVFRDYMRANPELSNQYSRLKEELARQYPDDMESYIAGKNGFIKMHEQAALSWWKESNRQI